MRRGGEASDDEARAEWGGVGAMDGNKQFVTNVRAVFGALVSLGVAVAFLADWIPPATDKEMSVGISIALAWLFINDWRPS